MESIKYIEKFPTSLDTYVMGPMKFSARSRTSLDMLLAKKELISIPMSTYESALYTCVNRGAKFSRLVPEGIHAVVIRDIMTRAPVLEARDIEQAMQISKYIGGNFEELKDIAQSTTRFGTVLDIKAYHVGNDVYVRLIMQTGEAAGHNMTTKAGTRILQHLLKHFDGATYGSDSGNMCTDKKSAAINAITGRGKSVITEINIPREICEMHLKTTPEAIERLNTKKNLQGSIAAGTQFSANAHYSNIIAAMYIATGQDVANVVEGSYGITQAKVTNEGNLYFSTTHPCLIVGSKGHGRESESQQRSLKLLGCLEFDKPNGYNAQRLAAIVGAAAALGELSLLADQTTGGRLIQAHERFERTLDIAEVS